MRISRGAAALISVMMSSALLGAPAVLAQDAPGNAVDATQFMASQLDGAGGGISSADQVQALQDAGAAGDPMALWQLGLMYEAGEGVKQDRAMALNFFSEIANDHADTAPRGLEADIVAHSFVKISEYYKEGLPEAGIAKDESYSTRLLMHAASYFGDPDAQYLVGEAYLDDKGLGNNPVLSARWLSLAAKKGHVPAQARLGDLLFNGDNGIKANPVEGLMWLTVASRQAGGTTDSDWINDLLNADMSVATPDQRKQAVEMADRFQPLPVEGTP